MIPSTIYVNEYPGGPDEYVSYESREEAEQYADTSRAVAVAVPYRRAVPVRYELYLYMGDDTGLLSAILRPEGESLPDPSGDRLIIRHETIEVYE